MASAKFLPAARMSCSAITTTKRRPRAVLAGPMAAYRRSRQLDEDGNLYIVGRSKDVIIDSNGKNIYPDEIEDLYGKSPFIKEMSVVGLAGRRRRGKDRCTGRTGL